MPRQLRVVHGRMRAQGDQKIESGDPGSQFLFQDLEHQGHGHGAGAVGDQHQNPPPIYIQPRESFGSDPADLGVRQETGIHTGRDDGTLQGGWHRRADKPV